MTMTATDMSKTIIPTGCCEPFDPDPWQDRELVWKDKPFLKDHVRCLFHVPLDMGRKVMKDMALIQAAGAQPEHPLMLSDDQSPWGADLYIEVTKAVPGATLEPLSGRFFTHVFEGPFRDAGKWAAEMRTQVSARGHELDRLYFGYTTCPRCAKAYGKNYVVVFAKLKEGRAFSRGIS